MKRWLIAGVILCFMMLALVQTGLGQGGGKGPLPFNPQTVETVQGIVVEAPEVRQTGLPEMEHLTLKTKQEKLTVVLGPNWYLAKQGWKINLLDRLDATGSRLNLDGKPALIAQEVKKGDQVMKFRDSSGRPLWARPRPQAQ
jgi:hypothetical protein|uniref:DNA-binding protein n=1 Tax=Desulfobacca acetoxidans TaxID=60893 RepID=A0A7V6A590_9BACT